MFKLIEIEKMFLDPLDIVVEITNKYLMNFKIINVIFS